MATDLPNDTTTTGVVTVGGGPVSGRIDSYGDSDWYAVTLTAGVNYEFQSGAGIVLRDATGAPVYSGGSDFVFAVEKSGLYYLDNRGGLFDNFDYSVSVDPFTPAVGASDVPGNATTTTELVVGGGVVSGIAEDRGDSDWYSVTLEADHTYQFETEVTVGAPFDNLYAILRDASGEALTHSIAAPVYTTER